MVIWNPLIRKYMEIPKEPIEKRSGFEYPLSVALEFGKDLHNHDYKVLRIVEFSNRGIVAFDLATKKFRVFTRLPQTPIYWRTYLENLKGQLCIIRNMMMYEDVKEWNSDVWLMKEHGDESSWTWNYKIQRVVSWSFEYWKPLMFSKNGKKILMEEWYRDHTYLIWSLLLLDGDNVIDPTHKDNSRHLVQGIEGNVEKCPRAIGLLAKVFWTTSELKPLVRFQCVSKGWHALINGQDFIKLHLHHSFKSNTDCTLIVQEQNAGIPFDFFPGVVIAIWNPLIRKYRKLPREPIEKPSGFSNSWPFSLAFGYDSHNEDYKSPENIVAFNLATEKFRVITTPLKAPTSCVTCLEVLEGQLCFIVIVDEMYNDVWLMKEYGEESSWTWIYEIEQGIVGSTFEYCKSLMCSKNNGKKILMEECHMYCSYLIWYDIEKKTRKRVKSHKLPAVFQMATCKGVFFCLMVIV
uniref:F-box protein n=1 Tax=Quercus lobata TaxID=97700 RepID=A0A7N2LTZ1_QUELO